MLFVPLLTQGKKWVSYVIAYAYLDSTCGCVSAHSVHIIVEIIMNSGIAGTVVCILNSATVVVASQRTIRT